MSKLDRREALDSVIEDAQATRKLLDDVRLDYGGTMLAAIIRVISRRLGLRIGLYYLQMGEGERLILHGFRGNGIWVKLRESTPLKTGRTRCANITLSEGNHVTLNVKAIDTDPTACSKTEFESQYTFKFKEWYRREYQGVLCNERRGHSCVHGISSNHEAVIKIIDAKFPKRQRAPKAPKDKKIQTLSKKSLMHRLTALVRKVESYSGAQITLWKEELLKVVEGFDAFMLEVNDLEISDDAKEEQVEAYIEKNKIEKLNAVAEAIQALEALINEYVSAINESKARVRRLSREIEMKNEEKKHVIRAARKSGARKGIEEKEAEILQLESAVQAVRDKLTDILSHHDQVMELFSPKQRVKGLFHEITGWWSYVDLPLTGLAQEKFIDTDWKSMLEVSGETRQITDAVVKTQ